MLFRAGELAAIQEDAEGLLIGDARVLTLTSIPDGGGGTEEGWVPGDWLDGRIAAMGKATGADVTAEQIDERATHIVTLPAGTELSTAHRIEIADAVWTVTALRTRTDEMVVRAEVKEARD